MQKQFLLLPQSFVDFLDKMREMQLRLVHLVLLQVVIESLVSPDDVSAGAPVPDDGGLMTATAGRRVCHYCVLSFSNFLGSLFDLEEEILFLDFGNSVIMNKPVNMICHKCLEIIST